jgi:hypothetical protein
MTNEARIAVRHQDHDAGLGGDVRDGTDGLERRDVARPVEVEDEDRGPVSSHRMER